MATVASTPFSGRGFVPDEDENTCAIDVFFKKPLPQKQQQMDQQPLLQPTVGQK